MIRKAEKGDISRIAEILVFSKRTNYRSIFQDDTVSFGTLQVLPVAREYLEKPELLQNYYVYDDGFVKGLIHVRGEEVKELYVDPFFVSQGIGGKLLDFAMEEFPVHFLWVLEENYRGIRFYENHGFHKSREWEYLEGTTQRQIKMER